MLTGADTKRRPEDYAKGTRVIRVDDYASEAATATLLSVADQLSPARIVSNSELDVWRAAVSRDLLEIPGMKSSVAIEFRDKVSMKRLFERAKIAAPRFREVQTPSDVRDAIAQFGRVVLKPRSGMGSQGVHVLSSPQDIKRLAALQPSLIDSLFGNQLLLEEFIDGEVYHIDAMFDHGRLVFFAPAKYLFPPHTFRRLPSGSALLDPGSPDYFTIMELTMALATTLGPDSCVDVVHLELFKTVEGEFLAGEVAARLGGGMIKNTAMISFGLDLAKEVYLLAAGQRESSAVVGSPMPAPRVLSGHKLWTTHTPFMSAKDAPEWATSFWTSGVPGALYSPSHADDARGGVVVEGHTTREVEERLNMLN